MSKIKLLTGFIYNVDDNVDYLLNQIMDNHELTEFVYNNEYTMTLRFGNKISAELCNSGRYFAWLSEGKIKVNGELFFTWDHARPKRKTMNRLLRLMDGLMIPLRENQPLKWLDESKLRKKSLFFRKYFSISNDRKLV